MNLHRQSFIISFLFIIILTSCDNSSTKTASRHHNKNLNAVIPTQDAVDNNFNDFIEKFSTDTAFQLSRTKFPLKTKWYDINNERDSLIYKERSEFEMIDFRKRKSIGLYDQWEQTIVVDKNNASATIEIRGIENGITLDFIFDKINEAWMLIEIVDKST